MKKITERACSAATIAVGECIIETAWCALAKQQNSVSVNLHTTLSPTLTDGSTANNLGQRPKARCSDSILSLVYVHIQLIGAREQEAFVGRLNGGQDE